MQFGLLKTKLSNKRHYVVVMTLVVMGLIGVIFSPVIRPWLEGSKDQGVEQISPYARFAPVRLVIPKINLDTSFVAPLNLLTDKTVAVPDSYDQVGWYSGGVTPGEIGAAVILGHVDSREGPAVFYSLGQLKAGDEIVVDRTDGSAVTFVVTDLKRYAQTDFPTELVYGQTDDVVLRLVTCTGTFDKGEQKYSHNLVVFAALK